MLLINKWIPTYLNAKRQVHPRQAFNKEHSDSKCHIHIHSVKVSIILACKKQDRTTGNTRYNSSHRHPPRPRPHQSEARAVTLVFRLEWSRQAQQRGVSLPQSGTSPGDRREEGLPPSAATAASAGHRRWAQAEICQTARGWRSDAVKGERRGSSHFGSGFGQTVAAYSETAKSTPGRYLSKHNSGKQRIEGVTYENTLSETHLV